MTYIVTKVKYYKNKNEQMFALCHTTLTYEKWQLYNRVKQVKEDNLMKNTYVKTILYAYPNLPKIMNRLKQIIIKRAITSMDDYTSSLSQCEALVKYATQKAVFYQLHHAVKLILSRLEDYKIEYLKYKYFNNKCNLEVLMEMELNSRKYFRRQNQIVKEIGKYLEFTGIDDNFFEQKLMKTTYIKRLYQRVCEEMTNHHQKEFLITNKPRRPRSMVATLHKIA